MGNTMSMTRNQNCGVSAWSDHNHDLLFLVMMKLEVFDILAFSGVCKSWRSFALSNRKTFMASIPPMIISISTSVNMIDRYCYLDDLEGRRFKTILPNSVGSKCVGLTCGYLILFKKETRDFWLVNLITRHQLHFPYLPLKVKASSNMYHGLGAILVFSPSRSAWVFVVVHKDASKIWFSIAGEGTWNHVSSFFPIIDLHAFNGKVYAINVDYDRLDVVHLCEIRFDPEPNLILFEPKNFPKSDSPPTLVSSGENLYVMYGGEGHWYDFHELDFGEMKWVSREKTTHEHACFYNSEHIAVFNPESWAKPWSRYWREPFWANPRLNYVRYAGTNKSWKDWFYTQKMWYFPHDCYNVNLIHD